MDIWIKGRTSVSRKRRARQLGTHTFYIGTLKGVGRISQQTFLDTYTKFAIAKLYDRKTPLVAAELLNDRVIPFRRASDTAATGSDFLNAIDIREILIIEGSRRVAVKPAACLACNEAAGVFCPAVSSFEP
jgi:hypothetical protein